MKNDDKKYIGQDRFPVFDTMLELAVAKVYISGGLDNED
jgi:hypothetical protein